MPEPWVFTAGGDNLTYRFDYDGSNNCIYIGAAQPGSLTSDAVWRIKQLNYTGTNCISILFPTVGGNASGAFSFIYNNRASLTYA